MQTLQKSRSQFNPERLPAAFPFYERELDCQLSRPNRKGWRMGRCPFHKSKSGRSFAVHDSGRFFCHGCQQKGQDIIRFIQLRDHCSFVEACKRLGCWGNVTPAEQLQLDQQRRRREQERQLEQEKREQEREDRIRLCTLIHTLLRVRHAAAARLDELHNGGDVYYENEPEDMWALMALTDQNARDAELEYLQICGLSEENL